MLPDVKTFQPTCSFISDPETQQSYGLYALLSTQHTALMNVASAVVPRADRAAHVVMARRHGHRSVA
jgi:hypothetical protein